MSPLSPPRIVCAANRYSLKDGGCVVIPAPRHLDTTMRVLVRQFLSVIDLNGRSSYEEGFIDQHGRFYNRQDAWMIAALNDQIIRRVGGDGPEQHGLFNENLY